MSNGTVARTSYNWNSEDILTINNFPRDWKPVSIRPDIYRPIFSVNKKRKYVDETVLEYFAGQTGEYIGYRDNNPLNCSLENLYIAEEPYIPKITKVYTHPGVWYSEKYNIFITKLRSQRRWLGVYKDVEEAYDAIQKIHIP